MKSFLLPTFALRPCHKIKARASTMVFSSLLKYSGKHHMAATVGFFSACGIFYSCSTTEKTLAEGAKEAKNSTKEKDEELFENQCLKRQLFQPKLPYPAWEYNWDGRMTEDSTLEASRQQVPVSGKTRHVILVRHGQYDETSKDDMLRKLTPLGRLQAERTGARLARMAHGANSFDDFDFNGPCIIRALRSSNMTRARETAEIISKHLKMRLEAPDPLLDEALPSPMIPIRSDIEGAVEEIDANHDRVEEGFQKYIYRGEPGDEEADEFEIIVCHGNIIRYMFCRALQLPPEAWLRMSIFNCSITYLLIRPNGHVAARMLGDIGHLDYKESTFSSKHGFKW